jgi:recombination protein RecA
VEKEYDFNLIQQSGSWYQFKGEKLGQGRDNVLIDMENSQPLMDKLKKEITDVYNTKHSITNITSTPVDAKDDDDEDEI